jgi:hypothetical protein
MMYDEVVSAQACLEFFKTLSAMAGSLKKAEQKKWFQLGFTA